jgi:hypothetical protein
MGNTKGKTGHWNILFKLKNNNPVTQNMINVYKWIFYLKDKMEASI